MPMLTTPGWREASAASPVSTSAYRPLRFHRRWPSTVRIPLANRCTTSMVMVWSRTMPATTRPLEAPMSIAATTVTGWGAVIAECSWRSAGGSSLAQESGGDAGVDGDVQPGGVRQVGRAQHEHGVGDVVGQHLPLQQGPLGVVLAQVLLLDPV